VDAAGFADVMNRHADVAAKVFIRKFKKMGFLWPKASRCLFCCIGHLQGYDIWPLEVPYGCMFSVRGPFSARRKFLQRLWKANHCVCYAGSTKEDISFGMADSDFYCGLFVRVDRKRFKWRLR
jgi:hypothetical protein